MRYKTCNIYLSSDQLDLLVRVVSAQIEMCQQDLSDAIFHEDSGAVSDAEASLRALDAVMKALKISE
jgi:hypothetical protein